MVRRCGYLNESYPKEELKLRTKVRRPRYLLQGMRGMSQISGFCDYELVMPFTELGNTRDWTTFEGQSVEFTLTYWVRDVSGHLGWEVEWAVIYMTLVLWREIWTIEDIIWIYHHGSWNYGNGWDHPGRVCTEKRRSQ